MAKIDTSKIAGYEEMSLEDKLKALEDFDTPDTDLSGYVPKATADKYASEASQYKKKYNALLDDDEKKQQEQEEARQKMEAELEELRAEKRTNEHIANLVSLGYDKTTAEKVAKATVEGDFETVYKLQGKFLDEAKKNAVSEKLKETPAPNVGDEGDGTVDRDKFTKMSLAERQQLKNDDPDLFAELSK